MRYFFILLFIETVICTTIQLTLIRALRLRFPEKWRDWGEPHPFSLKRRTPGTTLVKLVFSRQIVNLGDHEISAQVRWLRAGWSVFLATFIAAVLRLFLVHPRQGSQTEPNCAQVRKLRSAAALAPSLSCLPRTP